MKDIGWIVLEQVTTTSVCFFLLDLVLSVYSVRAILANFRHAAFTPAYLWRLHDPTSESTFSTANYRRYADGGKEDGIQ